MTPRSAPVSGVPRPLRAPWSRLAATAGEQRPAFDTAATVDLPDAAARWLRHVIEPGTVLRDCARLVMHGEIRVKRWMPFTAQQILTPAGFIWAARAGRFPLRITGFDCYADHRGRMRWKLGGLVPVVTADGPDVTRSAAGRLAGEALLIPGRALGAGVRWRDGRNDTEAVATVADAEFTHDVTVTVDDDGALSAITFPRWGNPVGGSYAEHPFGVELSAERAFAGYRIPTRMSAGWWHGTDRWDEGVFFRATIDEVELL